MSATRTFETFVSAQNVEAATLNSESIHLRNTLSKCAISRRDAVSFYSDETVKRLPHK
jgi:hypothetical protein